MPYTGAGPVRRDEKVNPALCPVRKLQRNTLRILLETNAWRVEYDVLFSDRPRQCLQQLAAMHVDARRGEPPRDPVEPYLVQLLAFRGQEYEALHRLGDTIQNAFEPEPEPELAQRRDRIFVHSPSPVPRRRNCGARSKTVASNPRRRRAAAVTSPPMPAATTATLFPAVTRDPVLPAMA